MNQEQVAVDAPKAAATLMLLRDASGGPEVLLLKRHGLSDVLGGAFVFPGGKLDTADTEFDASTLDASPATLLHRLAEPVGDEATAAGLFVAPIREACEESGVLLACDINGSGREPVAARLRASGAFGKTMAELGIRMEVSALIPWSRWITPVSQFQAKRY
jgi:8-oxo-dGTP pyrophosphatase MutT (NUDIX family)